MLEKKNKSSPTAWELIIIHIFVAFSCGQFRVQIPFESLQVLAQLFSFSAVFSFFVIFPWAAARQHYSSLGRSDCFEKSTRTGIYSYFLSDKELCLLINNFLKNAQVILKFIVQKVPKLLNPNKIPKPQENSDF